MEDRKLKSQQHVTRKLQKLLWEDTNKKQGSKRQSRIRADLKTVDYLRGIKYVYFTREWNRRTVMIILISEQLVTETVNKNQESSSLVRLNPAYWKFHSSNFGTSAHTEGRQEIRN